MDSLLLVVLQMALYLTYYLLNFVGRFFSLGVGAGHFYEVHLPERAAATADVADGMPRRDVVGAHTNFGDWLIAARTLLHLHNNDRHPTAAALAEAKGWGPSVAAGGAEVLGAGLCGCGRWFVKCC